MSERAAGEEAEELREVLRAVSDFVKELVPTVKELVSALTGELKGDVLGEEVARFYKSLIEAGIKEGDATRLAEQFLSRKMAILDVVSKVVSELGRATPRRKEVEEEVVERGEEPEKGGARQ